MIRMLSVAAGLALASSVASAAFLGIEVREDKGSSAGVSGVPANARTFNLYAKFNAIASAVVGNPAQANTVITVGQNNATAGWGINKSVGNTGASFFQQTAFGSDTAPNPNLVAAFPDVGFDSFVTIGVKVNNAGPGGGDSTSNDPDFNFGTDFITGGWFNSGGNNLQGAASDGTVTNLGGATIASNFNAAKGTYDVLIAQVTILGLDAGAISGEGLAANGNATSNWQSSIFTGGMIVFTQKVGGGAVANNITFSKVPAPSTLAFFGVAGVAATRRRRA